MTNRNHKPKKPNGRAAATPPHPDEAPPSDAPAIVVGVGTPSGGLDPIRKLFAAMPTGYGLAFVIVQHPAPGHENLTVSLLKNLTSLNAVEAGVGTPVQSDHVYVIPPGKYLGIAAGQLSLVEPAHCHGLPQPIDHFFCALAADQQARAVGLVLSGVDSDGTMGLSEIKAAGGKAIVEDPQPANSAGMPQSPIIAGVADLMLPVEKMTEALLAFAAQAAPMDASTGTGDPDLNFRSVLNILRTRTGHDFRCYKTSTLVRRIRRRIALIQLKSTAEYVGFIQANPEEVRLLHKDLLIGVTDFFRQPEAWRTLEEKAVLSLIENASPGRSIRVWVPGCSTGKEAYSLAMLLTEHVEASGKDIAIQIFATDADEDALDIARRGTYSEAEIGANISPARLKRFFAHMKGQYHLVKALWELMVFAPQNLTSDPPFSKLDLISCRNLLIYLGRDIQRQIIALFHFALREGGLLFLGNTETVSGQEDLFEPVSKKWRIYRRIGVGRRMPLELAMGVPGGTAPARPLTAAGSSPSNSLAFVVQHVLAERFAPAAVIVDRKQ